MTDIASAGTAGWAWLRRADKIWLLIYDRNAREINRIDAGAFGQGRNELFYNGLDAKGKSLKPGEYIFKIRGSLKGVNEVKDSTFIRGKDSFK